MSQIHLTINPFSDTKVTTSSWPVSGEPERVAVRFKDREYIVVLDKKPFFEIYSIDNAGELDELEQRLFPARDVENLLNQLELGLK